MNIESATSLTVLCFGTVIGLALAGMLLGLLFLLSSGFSKWLSRATRRAREWVIRAGGGVPWLEKDVAILTSKPGQHQTFFVSRHHLAEGGLECPLCHEIIPAGNFTGVYRTMVDGRENEVIICQGKRKVEGVREVKCETMLIASPDTEHGDHLNDKGEVDAHAPDPPDYYRFVRAPADQALREKWGVTAAPGEGGSVVVTEPKPENPGPANDVLIGAQAGQVKPGEAETKQLPAIKPPALEQKP
jgi:hypothetical protein